MLDTLSLFVFAVGTFFGVVLSARWIVVCARSADVTSSLREAMHFGQVDQVVTLLATRGVDAPPHVVQNVRSWLVERGREDAV